MSHSGKMRHCIGCLPLGPRLALALPQLVMLDEFQDIRRLQHFPGTETLWAALREALDRRGHVAFAIAGS